MKGSLKEQIERIHSLSYGKNTVYSGKLASIVEQVTKKVDDPKKADLVSDDVSVFFKTLEDAAESGGLKQQMTGYSYQKPVETLQIGLMLLGYDLPKHGVDGKFGPETAEAVKKFKADNSILNEETSDIEAAVAETGNKLKNGGAELESGGPLSDEVDNVVADILRDFKKTNPEVTIQISGGNDKFHKTLPYKSQHTLGNAIDLTLSPANSKTKKAFENLLQQYKQKVPNFKFINEYDNPTKYSTGGHFHLAIHSGGSTSSSGGGKSASNISFVSDASPDVIKKMIELLKTKNIKSEDLKRFIDTYVPVKSLEGVAATDFEKIVDVIIDNLEGGYYHPKMLQDGRVNDQRYENSGETMFGLDRRQGGDLNTSPEGQQFWALIDKLNASENWRWNYKGGQYAPQLKELLAKVMRRQYQNYQGYLTKEARDIVNSSAKLTFNFVYATWNGPGWFKRFARILNNLVRDGVTDPNVLADKMVEARISSGNSLIAQGGAKIDKIMDTAIV